MRVLLKVVGSNTITLNALASSDDDAYNKQVIFLRSGTGEDQVRLINDYNGTTKVATVSENWAVNPNTTTGYVMLPTHLHDPSDVWAESTRTLTSFGTLVSDVATAVWGAVTRTLSGIGSSGIASESNATSNTSTIVSEIDDNELLN